MKKHAGFLLITSLFLLLLSCQSKSPESPEPLWIFRADLPLLFLQNIDEERLGVKSADAFFILDKASGEVLHRYAPPGFGVAGALLEGNRLYYGGSDYYFRCTDVLKQKELWKIRTRSINEEAPLLDERSVYWGSGDSTVYA
ncbi:MAG: PQQ-like beta-propeller repeat protein, partial [Calditrichaeota bacterium]|nr:PQQ-like beta-propeller repeat protein [Calditrichota bacterium]